MSWSSRALLTVLAGLLAAPAARAQDVTPDEPPPHAAKVETGARLYARWRVTDRRDKPQNEFSIAEARVSGIWRPIPEVRAVLEVELSALADEEASTALLRDAYIQVAPVRALRLSVGQFKKPFSRIQLYPRRRLPLVRRGLLNDEVVEGLGYGGRDIGVQIDGRVGKGVQLRYALGVFNGAGLNAAENDLDGSKDFAGRVESRLGKHLRLGVNVAYRTFDRRQQPLLPDTAVATGADFEVQAAGLHALGEVDAGSDSSQQNRPRAVGGLLLLWYHWRITKVWAAEPLAAAELVWPDRSKAAHAYRITAGANALLGSSLRWMVDYELTRTVDVLATQIHPERRLFVQLAFDE